MLNSFTAITFDTMKADDSVGTMLDKMDESTYLFAPVFNDIFRDIVKSTELYSQDIINDSSLTDAKLNAVRTSTGGWVEELGILTQCSVSGKAQDGSIIDTIRTSILIGDRIDDFVWKVVDEQELEAYSDEAKVRAAVNAVNGRIDAGKATTDPTDDWSWAQEVELIKNLADAKATNNTLAALTIANEVVAHKNESLVYILAEGFLASLGIPLL